MARQQVILPYAAHGSQFAFGLRGACTLLAAAVVRIAALGPAAAIAGALTSVQNLQQNMLAIYQNGRKFGDCDPNGASTLAGVARILARLGVGGALPDTLWYGGRIPTLGDWHSLIHKHAGQKPMVMQVGNGQALRDKRTGRYDQSGLQRHCFAIVGIEWDDADPSFGGYICVDGDQGNINNDFVTYDAATLAAAQPYSVGVWSAYVAPAQRVYVVAPGDTLSKIAGKEYGNVDRWPDIWHANQALIGNTPDTIQVGWHLIIP